MKALSIRQPWVWAICHAGKDIENRDWKTNYRGRFYIHASKTVDAGSWADVKQILDKDFGGQQGHLPTGAIVGSAELVDCVESHPSKWFFGRYGFVLANVRVYERTYPCKGSLGFFGPVLASEPHGMGSAVPILPE